MLVYQADAATKISVRFSCFLDDFSKWNRGWFH